MRSGRPRRLVVRPFGRSAGRAGAQSARVDAIKRAAGATVSRGSIADPPPARVGFPRRVSLCGCFFSRRPREHGRVYMNIFIAVSRSVRARAIALTTTIIDPRARPPR